MYLKTKKNENEIKNVNVNECVNKLKHNDEIENGNENGY